MFSKPRQIAQSKGVLQISKLGSNKANECLARFILHQDLESRYLITFFYSKGPEVSFSQQMVLLCCVLEIPWFIFLSLQCVGLPSTTAEGTGNRSLVTHLVLIELGGTIQNVCLCWNGRLKCLSDVPQTINEVQRG